MFAQIEGQNKYFDLFLKRESEFRPARLLIRVFIFVVQLAEFRVHSLSVHGKVLRFINTRELQ